MDADCSVVKQMIFWGATGQAKVLRECMKGSGIELVALFDNNENLPSPFVDIPLYYGATGFEEWIKNRDSSDSLGFLETGAEVNWSLTDEGAFDVLTKQSRGVVIKKMHISKLGYLISKIEYYDSEGRALAVAELNNYKEIAEGFFVPASIKIIAYNQDDGGEPLGITLNLKTIKPKEFNEKQKRLFELPPKQGFDHILRNKSGKWIEESQ